MEENASDAEGQWKDRYLDIINTLEAKQADAEASIELMQRYLKRWVQDFTAGLQDDTSSAQWQSATLDSPKAVRNFLESIETFIRPNQSSESDDSGAQAWLDLVDLLDQQKLAKSLRVELKRFRQDIRAGELGSPIEAFQDILSSFLEQHLGPSDRRGGLWQRLRRANALEANAEAADADDGTGGAADPDSEVLAQGLDIVRRKINGILYTLIDQVKVPDAFGERKNKLRSDLNEVADWDALPNILSETTSLVFISNSVHQHEFEGFLQGLNAKLGEIQSFLNESREIEVGVVQAAEKLDSEVKNSIDGLQAVLAETHDLHELKKNVQVRLDRILDVFDKYQETGTEKRSAVLDKLEKLSQRMEVLEDDSQRLRAVIERQRQDSLKDTLTGLPNRQCYEEQGIKEIARVRRHGHALSLVVADIDHFKGINDHYGHLAGDRVLKLVSQAMVNRLRTSDLIARYGGEEFVILMPDTSVDDAVYATDQLRAAIEKTKFHYQNQRVKITVSFGVTQVTGNDTLEKAFVRADKALYEAKSSGRNCVRRAIDDEAV